MNLQNGNKAVYQNKETGKFYTSVDTNSGPKLVTVFMQKSDWAMADSHLDKKGREYKIFDLIPFKTKNGFDCYKIAK